MKKTLIICSLLCLLAAATSTAASAAATSGTESSKGTSEPPKSAIGTTSATITTALPQTTSEPTNTGSDNSLKQISLFGNSIGIYKVDWAIELRQLTADKDSIMNESDDQIVPGYIINLPLGNNENALELKVDLEIEKTPPIKLDETTTTLAPVTQAPTTQAPTTQTPTTQVPTTQKPVTQAPTTQAPATQKPATQKPATQKPATQKPTTQNTNGSGAIPEKVAPKNYTEDDLLWLARIIHAEARGESMEAKIAVGTVVLNRVDSSRFPNTIYGVIFQKNQFSPVNNGKIYNTPNADSYEAARRCLEGERTDRRILYFMMTKYASGTWMDRTRKLIVVIGSESFYA